MLTGIKKMMKEKDKSSLYAGLWNAAALNFLFFIYGTLEMFFLNKRDMLFGVDQVLLVIVPLFLIGFFLAALVFFVLWMWNSKVYTVFSMIYFIAYLATYIQGTFLLKELPVMDGAVHDWSELSAGRVKTILDWVIVTVLVVLVYRFLKKAKYFFAVRIISICMMLMLAVTGVTLYFQSGSNQTEEIVTTFDKEFEFSTDKNYIILLLDSVSSEMANEILSEDQEFHEMFTDFTFYRNMLGSYINTSYAFSFLFSGEWYENQEDYDVYRNRAYSESKLFADMESRNYKIGLYTPEIPANKEFIQRFENVVDLERTVTSFSGAANYMIRFAGYRYGMFDLKRFFNINLYACYEYFTPLGHTPYTTTNKQFYEDLQKEKFTYTDEPWFKFIHIEGAHIPWILNREVMDDDESDYKSSVEASFTITKLFLERLKEQGIYDNSVIIIMADHGIDSGDETDGTHRHQMPFFCVKGIGEKHDFQISDAPVSAVDYLEAFKRLADGKPGTDIFDYKEGDERERRFIWYTYGNQNDMQEYVQTGHVFEVDKFVPTGQEYYK